MFKKNILFLIVINFLISSCADTFDSVKRGLTGAKQKSGDEFLVEKKDPLILPPNYEELPEPSQSATSEEHDESFEKTLGSLSEETTETDSSNSSKGTEQSILEKMINY